VAHAWAPAAADAASHWLQAAPLLDTAQDTPIWENLLRYTQYFFSVMLGTGYVILRPFGALLKNPLTAVLLIGGTIGLFIFVKTTVAAMLGTDDLFQYNTASIPLQLQ
jgi:Protein of unknown function (DUF751)